MAVNYGKFKGYEYIRLNGINVRLIEELLAGLEKASPAGIRLELPGKENEPEFLPLDAAAELVMSWFIEVEQTGEADQRTLQGLISKKAFPLFAHTLQLKLKTGVEDPLKLQTAARLQAVEEFRRREAAATTEPRKGYDPGAVIDAYNQIYTKLVRYGQTGVPPSLIRGALLDDIPYGSFKITEQVFSEFIVQNLTRLAAAGRVGTDTTSQDAAVAEEVVKLIRTQNPELESYLNFLGDREITHRLHEYTEKIARKLEEDGGNLDDFERQGVAAAKTLGEALPTHTELLSSITGLLPFTNKSDRERFAAALLKEIVSSSQKPLTAQQIIELTSRKLGLSDDTQKAVVRSLAGTGIATALEYRQNEMVAMVHDQPLPRSIKVLIKKGINPFLAHTSEAGFAAIEAQLLAEYNAQKHQNFTSLQAAYQHEASSANPDRSFLAHFRRHFEERDYFHSLTSGDKSLIERTINRGHQTLLDRWIDFEDTITGRKALRKFVDNWDAFAGKVTIPGTKIPLFKISTWFFNEIDSWKKAATLRALAASSEWKNPVGRFVHWNLQEYQLGGFTTTGAISHISFSLWSKGAKWATLGVVRNGVVFSTRTGRRLLLKIGGRALARSGAKALTALAAAATGIGAAIGAILTGLLILDLVKLGWNFLKNFIVDSDFRNKALAWGAGIWAALTGISLAAIFSPFIVMFAVAFEGLMLALAIGGVLVFTVPQIQNNIKNTIHLDPGTAFGIISSLVCNEAGSGNACADKAVCLAKYLNECYGSSVTASDFGSGNNSLQCILAKGIDAAAGNQIYYSAIGYTNLQCVGFAQAAQTLCGRSLEGKNACNYVSGAAGYTFISGLAGVKPGDPVIIGSSNCSDGSPGHIAIFLEDAGALITVADANEVCPGCVKGDNKLPASSISGYLKKQ